mmetsp:Transcript_2321/g.5220  ORF Transcript_2321/g.5220 Transcript_2321/m.5220 type:complete len:81 (+) Transcript_2321:391-633(+)
MVLLIGVRFFFFSDGFDFEKSLFKQMNSSRCEMIRLLLWACSFRREAASTKVSQSAVLKNGFGHAFYFVSTTLPVYSERL